MPWLLKSRGRLLHIRDGDGPGRPLYVVDDVREYPFEHLPKGTDPRSDSDVLCREVDSLDGFKPAPTFAEWGAAAKVKAPPAPAPAGDSEPAKKKPKLR